MGGLSFMAWMAWSVQAHGVEPSLLASTPTVRVMASEDAILFRTDAPDNTAALIYLPGGGIDPRAYVPQVRSVADAGFPAAIVELPWRFAWNDEAREQVWHRIGVVRAVWGAGRPIVLAGHSRGGATAAWLAARHAQALSGLALIGTTHPRDDDLSSLQMPVLKILGERDCVAPPAAARANAPRLPSSTRWVEIAGGNHAQFGYYGSQINDCRARIRRAEQQRQVTTELVAELRRVSGDVQATVERH
jgi:pimeloyl-ACP methyl ester carboxylesterase